MNTKIFDSLNTFGNDSVSATKDLLSINGNLASKLLETQLGFAGLVIEAGAKQMDVASVSEPKNCLRNKLLCSKRLLQSLLMYLKKQLA